MLAKPYSAESEKPKCGKPDIIKSYTILKLPKTKDLVHYVAKPIFKSPSY